MPDYKTPGVYVEEISLLPPSVAQVETAIPAFIGYTEKGPKLKPTRIKSMVDYRNIFGGPAKALPKFVIEEDAAGVQKIVMEDPADNTKTVPVAISPQPYFRLYYALRMYFNNGGGPCYIISVETYTKGKVDDGELDAGLQALKKEDEPTLILFPDAGNIADTTKYHNLYINAMQQCADLQDRFTICNVLPPADGSTDPINDAAQVFRDKIGTSNLKYGAAYFPELQTSLNYEYVESEVAVTYNKNGTKTEYQLHYTEAEISDTVANAKAAGDDDATAKGKGAALKAKSLFHQDSLKAHYYGIRKIVDEISLVLPPGGAMAGIYAKVDSTRGVWKAPANVSVNAVKQPIITIDHSDQESLNIHGTGKSINAIRFFTGKGVLVWGARTLAGNDNEWKYISVRRFYNMVEESVKKASEAFVFEPNDANTWVKVRAMIENFLVLQWRAGALMGAAPEEAFFVKVGLGETMTSLDVLEGRMIIEIGMAVVRPAEFIILRFSHKMMEA